MNNTKRRVSCPQLTKLTFLFTLLLGWGCNVWGDTVIFDSSTDTSIPSGWTASSVYCHWNTHVIYSIEGTLESNNSINLSGKHLIIKAKARNSGSASLLIQYYNDGIWNDAKTFSTDNSTLNNYTEDAEDKTIDNISGSFKIKMTCTNIEISKITIADVSSPSLSVTPITASFGVMRTSDTKIITVSNTGVGSMDVTISNSNSTDFTISKSSITGIASGESETFTLTFNFGASAFGEKESTITVTPSNYVGDPVAISASATSTDVWEDFSSGIPSSWYNEDNSWSTTRSGYNGKANPGYNSAKILRTPRLYAEAEQAVSYEVIIGGSGSNYKIKAEYSTDRSNWSDIATYTTSGTYSFEAPASGYYWLRFTGYNSAIDNFRGFEPATPIHSMELGAANIPSTGLAHGDYTASVVVKELGGSDETVTAELFGDDELITSKEIVVNGNRDETISLSFEPTEEMFINEAYIKITYNGDVSLITSKSSVTISNTTYILDENGVNSPTNQPNTSGTNVVQFKYSSRNGWNTICVPFGLSNYMDAIFGTGWKAYAISSFVDNTLSFAKTTSFYNSTPYLVYAENADEINKNDIYLKNVSIFSSYWSSSNKDKSVSEGAAIFHGTFAPKSAGTLTGMYGVTNSGKIAKADVNVIMNGYRGYIEIPNGGDAARIFVIEDDGTTTDLGGLVRLFDKEAKNAYNLHGQKVTQARKGIYIVNGKKVVIK